MFCQFTLLKVLILTFTGICRSANHLCFNHDDKTLNTPWEWWGRCTPYTGMCQYWVTNSGHCYILHSCALIPRTQAIWWDASMLVSETLFVVMGRLWWEIPLQCVCCPTTPTACTIHSSSVAPTIPLPAGALLRLSVNGVFDKTTQCTIRLGWESPVLCGQPQLQYAVATNNVQHILGFSWIWAKLQCVPGHCSPSSLLSVCLFVCLSLHPSLSSHWGRNASNIDLFSPTGSGWCIFLCRMVHKALLVLLVCCCSSLAWC